MLAPHTLFRQLPSLHPHSQVTSDQTTFESSFHSSCRPLPPSLFRPDVSEKNAPPSHQLFFVNRRSCATNPSPVSGRPSWHRLSFFALRGFHPIHPCLAVARDYQLNALSVRRGLEYHRVEISRLCAGDAPGFVSRRSVARAFSRRLRSRTPPEADAVPYPLCTPSFSSPAHLVMGVSNITPLLFSKHSCFSTTSKSSLECHHREQPKTPLTKICQHFSATVRFNFFHLVRIAREDLFPVFHPIFPCPPSWSEG